MEYKYLPKDLATRLTEAYADVLNDACVGGVRAFLAGVLLRQGRFGELCFSGPKSKKRGALAPLSWFYFSPILYLVLLSFTRSFVE